MFKVEVFTCKVDEANVYTSGYVESSN